MKEILLFAQFRLRGVTFPNRIMLAPMCQYQAIDGMPNDWHRAHHGRYATSGARSVVVEATEISPGCTGLYNDQQVAAWRGITDLYRAGHPDLCSDQPCRREILDNATVGRGRSA